MHSRKSQQLRLQQINERLNRWTGKAVSKQELMHLCECSERTLKEDLQYLREEYSAPIAYDRKQKGYYYSQPFDLNVAVSLSHKDLAALEAAVTTLSQLGHLAPFKDLRGVVDKLERAVQFRFLKPSEEGQWLELERVPYFKGGELIGLFLPAIHNRQEVHFRHQRFDTEATKEHTIVPYLVKEHRNRWYVIGWQMQYGEIRVFGLDRILPDSLRLGNENQSVPHFDAAQYFRYSLGVAVYLEEQPQEVILSFTAEQGRYFKALPFFPFEEKDILVDTINEFRVRLLILINKELIYELARLGPGVKVLAPALLIDQLIIFHQKTLEQYISE